MDKQNLKNTQLIIEQVQHWLDKVVIGLNFCPFAKKPFIANKIAYHVCTESKFELVLTEFEAALNALQAKNHIETSLFIVANGFDDFDEYLDLLDIANHLLAQLGLVGEFQLASFHPKYCFAGVEQQDVENYTNRAPYPIIHIIREQSITRSLKNYPEPEQIPQRNIALAKQKGAAFFQQFLNQANED